MIYMITFCIRGRGGRPYGRMHTRKAACTVASASALGARARGTAVRPFALT